MDLRGALACAPTPFLPSALPAPCGWSTPFRKVALPQPVRPHEPSSTKVACSRALQGLGASARSHMRPSLHINLSCLFALPTQSRCLSASRTQRPRPQRDCVSSTLVERWNAIRWACKKSSMSIPCFTSFCVQETMPGNSAWRLNLVCNQTRLPMSLASINARFGGSEGSMELEQKESGRSIDPTKDGNSFTPLKHGAAIRSRATSPLYATTHPHPPWPEQ